MAGQGEVDVVEVWRVDRKSIDLDVFAVELVEHPT
jgi:hypothetical protein